MPFAEKRDYGSPRLFLTLEIHIHAALGPVAQSGLRQRSRNQGILGMIPLRDLIQQGVNFQQLAESFGRRFRLGLEPVEIGAGRIAELDFVSRGHIRRYRVLRALVESCFRWLHPPRPSPSASSLAVKDCFPSGTPVTNTARGSSRWRKRWKARWPTRNT